MSIKTKAKEAVNKATEDLMKEISNKKVELTHLLQSIKFTANEARKEIEAQLREVEKQKSSYKAELDSEYNKLKQNLQDSINKREEECLRREKWAQYAIKEEREIFQLSANMYSDINEWIFKDAESYLRNKDHPAPRSADIVKKLQEETRYHILQYRQWQYKIEILRNIFPELSLYIEEDSEDALLNLHGATINLDQLKDYEDNSKLYLTQTEWESLSTAQKNQLALDRYNQRAKSNWVLGIEYEMYIEFLLRKSGYKTIPHGSINGLEDLGRDIIATTEIDGETITYIIQCKRYASSKLIHENTICQLYGTSIEYALSNPNLFGEIRPVLYTTTDLSPMARKFATRLNVTVIHEKMDQYPQIKCNINNNGEKIYHLPFDQQYYHTLIDKPNEFYAWTVEEAENAGFRRAKKHTI